MLHDFKKRKMKQLLQPHAPHNLIPSHLRGGAENRRKLKSWLKCDRVSLSSLICLEGSQDLLPVFLPLPMMTSTQILVVFFAVFTWKGFIVWLWLCGSLWQGGESNIKPLRGSWINVTTIIFPQMAQGVESL